MVQPYDLPLSELERYMPEPTRRSDFWEFWSDTKSMLDQVPPDLDITLLEYPSDMVKVHELTFRGFGGARIRGWYVFPNRTGRFPGIVMHHEYDFWDLNFNINDVVNLAMQGYAVFCMGARGQYLSEDNSSSPHGHKAGWMSKGILNKETYYYRGVYMDACRAAEIVFGLNEVDRTRIGAVGASQGAALSLVTAAITRIPTCIVGAIVFLSDFRRAIDITPTGPYLELNGYFRHYNNPLAEKRAMETLSYFDVMNFAPWVKCPALLSTGLIDEIAPPSTVFAVYNHLHTSKSIRVYRYFGHENVPAFYIDELSFLKTYLNPLI